MDRRKKVFIVHGWGESPDKGWFPWLAKELTNENFWVKVLDVYPQPPIFSKWKQILRRACPAPDKNTFFVGHSTGCQTLFHYLAELPPNIIIGGAVLVAGWTDDLGMKELHNFFDKKLVGKR